MVDVNKPVGLIDMDGSGLPLLLRLLKGGMQVRYSSFLNKPLKAFRVNESSRKLMASAINSGQLEESRVEEIVSTTHRLVICHVEGLSPDIDKRDLSHIYRKICDLASNAEPEIVHTSIHQLGLMDWFRALVEQRGFKGHLYYLPHPLIVRGKLPVGGPPIKAELRAVVSLLAGRAQLFPGLAYSEAEAIALARLLKDAATYAAYLEAGLIVYKRYGVLHSETAAKLLGKGREGVWRRLAGIALLTLLEDTEDTEFQRSMLAGVVSRVLRESDKVVADILTKRLRNRRSARILVVGCRCQALETLKKRFKVSYIPLSEIKNRRLPTKIEAVISATRDQKILEQLKNLTGREGVLIDLTYFQVIKEGGERA